MGRAGTGGGAERFAAATATARPATRTTHRTAPAPSSLLSARDTGSGRWATR